MESLSHDCLDLRLAKLQVSWRDLGIFTSQNGIDMLLFAITFFGIFISYLNLFETNEQSANYVMIATKSYFLY